MIELCKSESDEEIVEDELPLHTGQPNSNNHQESVDTKTSKSEITDCINAQSSEKDHPNSNEENSRLLQKSTEINILDLVSKCVGKDSVTYNIDLANSNNLNSHVNNLKDNHTMNNLENISMNEGWEENSTSQDIRNSIQNENFEQEKLKPESDSQLLHLHYDSDILKDTLKNLEVMNEPPIIVKDSCENIDVDKELQENRENDFTFSDEDLNMDDINNLIENAEVLKGICVSLHHKIVFIITKRFVDFLFCRC